MASLMIHQVIGQEYCKRHKISQEASFLAGNLAPDLVQDKSVTHFSRIRLGNKTYTESILNKLNLPKSCESLDINDDFQKGEFLHLFTDYVFFYQYILNSPDYKQIEHLDQLTIRDIIYRDYHRINHHLINNYPDLDTSCLPDNAKVTRQDDLEVLSKDAIEKLILYCSSVDIETIYSIVARENELQL